MIQKRELGTTGEKVSEYCLGTMFFGTKVDYSTSIQLMDQYLDAGGSFLDTANIYSFWIPGFKGGESEELIGKWMKERGNRGDLFIATKAGFAYQDVPTSLKSSIIMEECEKSLKRLGTETIDLFYAHVDDRSTDVNEVLEALTKLVKQGKIRFIGASNYEAWRLMEALDISHFNNFESFCCIQQKYTYLRPAPGQSFDPQIFMSNELKDLCKAKNLALLAYAPLIRGAYADRKDRPVPEQFLGPDTDLRLKKLKMTANEINCTANQVVLSWMRQSSPSVIPLITGSSTEQLKESMDSAAINLSEEQLTELNS